MKDINRNTFFELLSLDKEARQKVIDSNPLLKKYFSGNTLKRKPKRLDSKLAKKLEDPRHRLTEKYYSLENIYEILELEEFDELRKETYLARYNQLQKIADSQERNSRLSQLYSQIKQDIEYFIGKEERQPIDGMSIEDQMKMNQIIGSGEFEE